jgi:hypothetical protein
MKSTSKNFCDTINDTKTDRICLLTFTINKQKEYRRIKQNKKLLSSINNSSIT